MRRNAAAIKEAGKGGCSALPKTSLKKIHTRIIVLVCKKDIIVLLTIRKYARLRMLSAARSAFYPRRRRYRSTFQSTAFAMHPLRAGQRRIE
ncbi:hypothetical protein [Paenibacillus glycinis]|uniref:Uncharacterized protein n=1 Tax=Paenibacillus glycinis TaxID=2697035 RepID=A0ABW9XS70_9BACL|nr:hypothetical protein [Paenibacillus glycinis]NBD25501.1 hypothetical protein [Paenibacillus glycinis]